MTGRDFLCHTLTQKRTRSIGVGIKTYEEYLGKTKTYEEYSGGTYQKHKRPLLKGGGGLELHSVQKGLITPVFADEGIQFYRCRSHTNLHYDATALRLRITATIIIMFTLWRGSS